MKLLVLIGALILIAVIVYVGDDTYHIPILDD